MNQNQARRAPHQGTNPAFHHAPNAALLIDFDNVTMGIRSDLGKELKSLLNSEVIRGKVAVQRAYADWRRYPQYIVPLAESSIDLIFAPAYGSSKKNATDLRMAIDAMELVFTRPEIGTFILMTGDSDFSSCVLKLKEYGKYVIGVWMRESSSDLLIQNCDEYYSYHSLSGLTRAGEAEESTEDPWVLLRRAVERMIAERDVMRTDRLKQVMLDLDPAFDEKKLGYSKFSRFVSEAATKKLVHLRKGENGQYEISLVGEPDSSTAAAPAASEPRGNGRRGRAPGSSRSASTPAQTSTPAPAPIVPGPEVEKAEAPPVQERAGGAAEAPAQIEDLDTAYGLLQQAVRALAGSDGAARDGDVKRRMLDLVPSFDESKLGFSKFTRFLRQAHDSEIVDLNRAGGGNYGVSLSSTGPKFSPPARDDAAESDKPSARKPHEGKVDQRSAEPAGAEASKATEPRTESQNRLSEKVTEKAVGAPAKTTAAAAPRRGRRTRSAGEGPPPLLPGQIVSLDEPEKEEAPAKPAGRSSRTRKEKAPAAPKAKTAKPAKAPAKKKSTAAKETAAAPEAISAADLGLPQGRESIQAYLTNSYRGVGKKTAETLLDKLGDDVFTTLEKDPERVQKILGKRADSLLEQWGADLKRRREGQSDSTGESDEAAAAKPSRKPSGSGRRGGRGGGKKKASGSAA